MANQVEIPKLTQDIAIGPTDSELAVPKLVMFVLLEPGESGPDDSGRQGHVRTKIIRS